MSKSETGLPKAARPRPAADAVKPDEFCDDGVTKKLNKSRPYGVVYCDGYSEAAFMQEKIAYRGDGIPVGYKPAAERGLETVIPPAEELLEENAELKARVDSQDQTIAELMRRLEALESPAAAPPAPAAPAGKATRRES